MATISLSTQPTVHRLLVRSAWVATLLMSRLPQILLREVFAVETSFAWTSLGAALLLLVVSYGWRTLQPLRGYLFVMAVVMLLTGPLDSLLRNSVFWTTWLGVTRGWTISFLGERLPLVIEALLPIVILVGLGMKRHDFFLAVGTLRAPVTELRLPDIANSWLLVGSFSALLLTLFFFFGSVAQSGMRLAAMTHVVPVLPAVLLFAVMNAFGEEVVYRAGPLSQHWHVVGEKQAIWLTAIWFGLGHYSGGIPSGVVGALMAGGIAVLYGKAMVETRGIVLSILMHMLTDVAIYIFLALAAVSA